VPASSPEKGFNVSKENVLKAAALVRARVDGWQDAVVRRIDARSDQGQTSVEYLGIIAVVVLIVAAILGTNIGTTIYNAITAQIAKVAH
jgi:Flp pilus assembly pilin Flp